MQLLDQLPMNWFSKFFFALREDIASFLKGNELFPYTMSDTELQAALAKLNVLIPKLHELPAFYDAVYAQW